MAYNPAQFKAKKKREVDPNAPPRPNLLAHEKKMKESQVMFEELYNRVQSQAEIIRKLQSKINDLELTVGWLHGQMNK